MTVVTLLTGCATDLTQFAVKVDPEFAAVPPQLVNVTRNVEVLDIRNKSKLKRTLPGGSPMGLIILQPTETELIKTLIEAALIHTLPEQVKPDKIPKIYCGIKSFIIETPATLFYWDVTVKIELILLVRGVEKSISARHSERTWIWPGNKIIARVTKKALQQIHVSTVETLPQILGISP